MTTIETAGRGMMAAATRLDAAASRIVRALPETDMTGDVPALRAQVSLTAGGGDLASAVVDQASALTAFKANVATFETADRTMKTLLDLKV
ncbi:MAG TPA: flagellar hook protein FlgE [Caulobacteraceae bacterium]|jgi:flagellar basal body rod protein FlgC|nr:flagellar hook protein FlgE [Caulobacteraceae bacterium]